MPHRQVPHRHHHPGPVAGAQRRRTLKAPRAAVYLRTLRKELLKISGPVGVAHPALITTGDIEITNGDYDAHVLAGVYGTGPGRPDPVTR